MRRRFGLSLPPPFAASPPAPVSVRAAEATDGAAIAAVKWRSWRRAYRTILPDAFLDDLAVVPTPGYWIGRAAVPPSHRHGCFVAGPRGTVLGIADVAPTRDEDLDREAVTEVLVLYVDPAAQRRGIGGALLAAAVDHARTTGAAEVVLWVAEANVGARAFYEAAGWRADGAGKRFEVTPEVAMEEVRYRLGPIPPP